MQTMTRRAALSGSTAAVATLTLPMAASAARDAEAELQALRAGVQELLVELRTLKYAKGRFGPTIDARMFADEVGDRLEALPGIEPAGPHRTRQWAEEFGETYGHPNYPNQVLRTPAEVGRA